MKKIKIVDKAEPVFNSIDFDNILTHTLSEEVNKELSKTYGDRIHIEVTKPGAFYIDIDQKGSRIKMEKLEQEVYQLLLSIYGDAYQKAKSKLAILEGVGVRNVE
jgi:hypothetical protein